MRENFSFSFFFTFVFPFYQIGSTSRPTASNFHGQIFTRLGQKSVFKTSTVSASAAATDKRAEAVRWKDLRRCEPYLLVVAIS